MNRSIFALLAVAGLGLLVGLSANAPAHATPPPSPQLALAASPVSVVPQLLEGRSGSELSLFLLLNGERTRTLQADAGGLALWTTDAGQATATVTGGGIVYIENAGTAACHVCGPLADGTWDAGCSTTTSDPNYGSPIPVGGYRWISLRDGTTTLKAVPASGSAAINCPVFVMR